MERKQLVYKGISWFLSIKKKLLKTKDKDYVILFEKFKVGEVMSKAKRNDPCPCGSGKKLKKCCMQRLIGGRFLATKIAALQMPQKQGLHAFFQNRTCRQLTDSGRTFEASVQTPSNSKSVALLQQSGNVLS
jgi:hypothetical protein